jgi:hypothetical protein
VGQDATIEKTEAGAEYSHLYYEELEFQLRPVSEMIIKSRVQILVPHPPKVAGATC